MDNAPAIEWDDDGYPTEESLDAARSYWADHAAGSWHEIDRWVRETLSGCAEICCASYDEQPATDSLDRPVIHARFSTGGWSGAEDVIGLIEGSWALSHRLLQWRRGGHYIFEFPAEG